MPEYLSPGVYVEEFEIGAKPIEGVSTSTAGFVGMTERGPIDKPTLVTNFGEYQKIFGGYLDKNEYGNKCYLPYSVEGFFSNGGQRLYVTRVADKSKAKSSSCFLPNISGANSHLIEDAKPKAITLKINNTPNIIDTLEEGKDILLLKDGSISEFRKYVSKAKTITLNVPLSKQADKNTDIYKMKIEATALKVSEEVLNGSIILNINDASSLKQDDILLIKDGPKSEICIIEKIEANKLTVQKPLKQHNKDIPINEITISAETVKMISSVIDGSSVIPIPQNDLIFKAEDAIKIGTDYYIIKESDASGIILIEEELRYPHLAGVELIKLVPAITIEAANQGTWGNRIKIVVRESSISKATLASTAPKDQNYLDLDTVTGIEKGSMIKLPSSYVIAKEIIKTDDTKRVILKTNITEKVDKDKIITTVEFDIVAMVLDKKGNPIQGSEEAFNNLSMNEDHSRYIEKIITIETSNLIRVVNVIKTANPGDNIIMPTQDKEPGWKLNGGDDGIPADSDLITIYKGKPNNEPLLRTGLETLKNIDDISIVGMPGISKQDLQNSLINHCENLKDRFAVLDSEPLADLDVIQKQRNLYDSKFAALYYPWIRVFDPVSKKPINVPPSGYMCGIYARSDTERGVHKAPANEVVSGALDLEEISEALGTKRIITKGQQDILNPKGINCIRVFPGRGIRVWGARTISSDSLWKYINVRRLFIYIEGSIYKGTQWVVFEPNNEKLWGRVKATIDEFLTRVWRDGALMGLKAEDAFFIKCDRTTMTQSDIDNGRLICVIGIAPVKPAEFVIFRIAQWAGGSAAKE